MKKLLLTILLAILFSGTVFAQNYPPAAAAAGTIANGCATFSGGLLNSTGAACGGSGSSPGGTTGAIQYNSAGAFGGAVLTGIVLGNGASAPTVFGGSSLAAHNFAISISASGVLTGAQPAFTDIFGVATGAQLPGGLANAFHAGAPTIAAEYYSWNTTNSDFEITAAPSGSGTVTSVGLSLPAIFLVTGSPITSSGTLAAPRRPMIYSRDRPRVRPWHLPFAPWWALTFPLRRPPRSAALRAPRPSPTSGSTQSPPLAFPRFLSLGSQTSAERRVSLRR